MTEPFPANTMKLKIITKGQDDLPEINETVELVAGTVITISNDTLHISRLGRAGFSADLTEEDIVTISVVE